MFKKFKKELDTEKINEVATLSARVLKIIYLLLAFHPTISEITHQQLDSFP